MNLKKLSYLLTAMLTVITTGCITPVNSANNTTTNPSSSPTKIATDISAKPSTPEIAKNTDYLNELEKNVLAELNKVRTDPEGYAKTKVKKYRDYYQGNQIVMPGQIPIITNEGVAAVDECYNELIATKAIGTLSASNGLSKAAKDLVNLQSSTTSTGHTASDGSDPFQRMDRYGKWHDAAAENIDYGNNDAEQIVLALLVDDGVSSRGHRKNIMSAKYNVIGLASGAHQTYNYMFVMDFAGSYDEK